MTPLKSEEYAQNYKTIEISNMSKLWALSFAAALCIIGTSAEASFFVSGLGSDSAPCTQAQPCRTLQHAIQFLPPAGGTIVILTSGDYPSVIVNKSIAIDSADGVRAVVSPPSSADSAITVNAGSGDTISLSGLVIDAGTGSSGSGIAITAAGKVQIKDCTIRAFASGVNDNYHQTLLLIDHTSFLGNTAAVVLNSALHATIDHVTALGGTYGVQAKGAGSYVLISNSNFAAHEENIEINPSGGPFRVTIDNVESNNADYGLYVNGGVVLISRSTISLNNTGIFNSSTSTSLYSLGNNLINSNITQDYSGSPPKTNLTLR